MLFLHQNNFLFLKLTKFHEKYEFKNERFCAVVRREAVIFLIEENLGSSDGRVHLTGRFTSALQLFRQTLVQR